MFSVVPSMFAPPPRSEGISNTAGESGLKSGSTGPSMRVKLSSGLPFSVGRHLAIDVKEMSEMQSINRTMMTWGGMRYECCEYAAKTIFFPAQDDRNRCGFYQLGMNRFNASRRHQQRHQLTSRHAFRQIPPPRSCGAKCLLQTISLKLMRIKVDSHWRKSHGTAMW